MNRVGVHRGWLRILAGLVGWAALQSAGCDQEDPDSLCNASDVTGQWQMDGTGDLVIIRGGLNDVTLEWTRSTLFEGESDLFPLLRWPPDQDSIATKLTMGEGRGVQEDADNRGETAGTHLAVEEDRGHGCWWAPGETACRIIYRLDLHGAFGSNELKGVVEVRRFSRVMGVPMSHVMKDFSVTLTRQDPLRAGSCVSGCTGGAYSQPAPPDGGVDGGGV